MQTQPDALLHRIQLRMAQARFVTLSALIHLAIIIMAGSVVLIKNTPEPPDFEAATGDGLFSPDASSAQPPPVPPEDAMPEFAPVQPQVSAPLFQAITSATMTASSFTMNASATALNLDDKLSKLTGTDGGKGMGDAIGRAMSGAGRMGGKGFFGSRDKNVNGLTGTFYDLKQTQQGKPTEIGVQPNEGLKVNSPEAKKYAEIVKNFVTNGWNASSLNKYFKAPNKLVATQFMMPIMSAEEAPKAFEVEKDVEARRWIVHYEGTIVPPKGGRYRFIGAADDMLIVRCKGRNVLDACIGLYRIDPEINGEDELKIDRFGAGNFRASKWIEMREGEPIKMEIVVGENPGGEFNAALLVEREGDPHPPNRFPVFQLAAGEVPQGKLPETSGTIVFSTGKSTSLWR